MYDLGTGLQFISVNDFTTIALDLDLSAILLFLDNCSSLSSNPPLHLLIGDLVLMNKKAKFVLYHKLILMRVPSSPYVAQTLVGYLSSTEHARQLLVNSLQSALEVWSDGSALRHMDLRQHLWISRVIVLSFTCLKEREIQPLKASKSLQ